MRIELDQLFIALPELLIIQFMKKDNVSRDSFINSWEVIQPAKEGKLEVSYRWFRSCKDAEDWCVRKCVGVTPFEDMTPFRTN